MLRNSALQEYLYLKQVVSLDEICREFAPRYPQLTELIRQLLRLVTFKWENNKVMCYLLRTPYGAITRKELQHLRNTATPTKREIRKRCKELRNSMVKQMRNSESVVSTADMLWAQAEKIIMDCFLGGKSDADDSIEAGG